MTEWAQWGRFSENQAYKRQKISQCVGIKSLKIFENPKKYSNRLWVTCHLSPHHNGAPLYAAQAAMKFAQGLVMRLLLVW